MVYIPRKGKRLKKGVDETQIQPPRRIRRGGTFVLFLISVAILSLIFSGYSLFTLRTLKDELARTQNVLNRKIEEKTSRMQDDIENLKRLLGPKGVMDRYISAANVLMNYSVDLEKIITEIQNDRGTGYFRIFISGPKRVWVGLRSGGKYVVQKEFTPGLSDEKFYFFKSPSVKTKYTISIPKNISLITGDPQRTYILLNYLGSYKVIRVGDLVKGGMRRVDNLLGKIGLRIP